ncbi:hypothetical protein M427DRAFT_60538, partial [Gonapodya prolifera JEL478]
SISGDKIILGCLLTDDNLYFEVSTQPSESVYALKDAIKAELSPELDDIPASRLRLWKVIVPYSARAFIKEETLKEEDEMEPVKEISHYFPQTPLPKKHIHVVVCRPPVGLLSL